MSDWLLPPAFWVLVAYTVLAVLGYLLMQMIYLNAVFRFNRDTCLSQLRLFAARMKETRQGIQKMDVSALDFPGASVFKGKWKVVYWVVKRLLSSKRASRQAHP